MSRKTNISTKLHKLNIAPPEIDTPLEPTNWMKLNRTGLRTNPQDLDRLTPEELGKRLHNSGQAQEIRHFQNNRVQSTGQISTLSNSVSPNRVGILKKSDVRQLLQKPR
jgi:hypothetical protein